MSFDCELDGYVVADLFNVAFDPRRKSRNIEFNFVDFSDRGPVDLVGLFLDPLEKVRKVLADPPFIAAWSFPIYHTVHTRRL